jgi:hypothetical protein
LVVEFQAARSRTIAEGGNQAGRICEVVERILTDARGCPVCQVADTAEAQATARVASRIRSAGAAEPDAVSALCLPHFGPILALLGEAPSVGDLLRRQASLLNRLAEDMRRFTSSRTRRGAGRRARKSLGRKGGGRWRWSARPAPTQP